MSDPNKPPVSTNFGLKASLEVKTEIPKEATGKLVAALTDAIRPFTEKRGLRADQIRLQREDVLLQIAQKAHQRAVYENLQLKPVPNKLLIPLLEKASLESNDELMQERWSSLLLSAATSFDSMQLTFVDILSRMSADELLLLEEVCLVDANFPHIDDFQQPSPENENRIRANVRMLTVNDVAGPDEVNDQSRSQTIFEAFERTVRLSYGRFMWAEVLYHDNAIALSSRHLLGRRALAVDILEREKLAEARYLRFSMGKSYRVPLDLKFFNATKLGVKFVESCAPTAKERALEIQRRRDKVTRE